MATLLGTALYIAQLAALTDASKRLDAINGGGADRIFVLRAPLAFAGTEVTADKQPLCILPKGAQIIPYLCRFCLTGDPSDGAVTMDIGTATDPDAFADGLVLSAGGPFAWTAPAEPDAQTNVRRIGDSALGADDTTIFATYAGVAGTLTARAMMFDIVYSLPTS